MRNVQLRSVLLHCTHKCEPASLLIAHAGYASPVADNQAAAAAATAAAEQFARHSLHDEPQHQSRVAKTFTSPTQVHITYASGSHCILPGMGHLVMHLSGRRPTKLP